jgi:hypothetical protein
LLAIRAVARIREVLHVDIALVDVFTHSILSALAEHVVNARLAEFDPDDLAQVAALLRETPATHS